MAMGAVKTKRFISRKIAELNETKLTNIAVKDLDEELQGTVGVDWQRRASQSEVIRGQIKEAEALRSDLKILYKSASGTMGTILSYRDSLHVLTKSLVDFQDTLEHTGGTSHLTGALTQIVHVHQHLDGGLKTLADSVDRSVVTPIQTFVKKDVRDCRYFAHDIIKTQVEYESSITKLNQIKTKPKFDAPKYTQTSQQLTQCQQKYDQLAEEFRLKFNHLKEANAHDNALLMISYLNGLRNFFNEGYQLFQQVGPMLDSMEREINTTSINNQLLQRRDTKQKSKMSVPTHGLRCDFLVKLLIRPDLKLLGALHMVCPPEMIDDLYLSIVKAFQQADILNTLFDQLIRRYVESAPRVASWTARSLFENNPPAAALLNHFLRTAAKYYVASVVGPVIRSIVNEKKLLELDPDKPGGENRKANASQLAMYVANIVDNVCRSKSILPTSLKLLCQNIASASTGSDYICFTAGLLFHQVLCPALTSPNLFHILAVESITRESRRSLFLLSLLLSNLANNHKSKEGPDLFLAPLDQIIADSFNRIREFCVQISMRDDAYSMFESEADEKPSADDLIGLIHLEDLEPVVSVLIEYRDLVEGALLQQGDMETANEVSALLRSVKS